ncbi:Long chain acyl-CoA synthetase 4 [Forsythia ovata]|uniref:Long-chain-fatty-acid--CoA ligase n=1 Tax=Forsythia ovata TaxID=205694 RepID=A0ABD1WGX5_9LAMI
MPGKSFIVEVEPAKEARDGRPSMGPVYRSVFAKDGFPEPIPGLDSCWDIFRLSVEKYPTNRMLGRREIIDGKPGKYVWMTYKEVYDLVVKVGNSIRSCGIEEGGRCGIYGANCPEWIMSMEACNAHGLYCVPLYDTLGAGAIEFIICHAEVTIAFVEDKKIPELLKTLPSATKYLRTIVSFGEVTPQQREEVENFGLAIYSWDEFLLVGNNEQFDLPVKKKSDICTIMYTSGTTGDPKGVMISNNSIVALIAGVKRLLGSVKQSLTLNDVYLSYLPLAHIFDRVIEECFINHGASIGFWRGDVKLLVEDIGELKPTIFCAVPRVLERIYSGLQQKIAAGGFIKHTLFNFAYSYKLRNMRKGQKHSEASSLCDKIVFSKVKQGLGGNVRLILSGAAPLASHVEEYLRVVSCSYVLQGYGLTETCAGTFVSIPDEMDMLGTVGPPVPNVDVRLESVPEMNYDALSSSPSGEVCIRGDILFSGYFKREDLTNEVLVDGWFHTGDIGEWQPNGSLKIIDRKKNIFKLSQGEYVAVENLENIYGLVPDIDSIWIYGNSFESFLIAVINPNKQAVEQWAEQNGISGDFNALCQNPKVKEYIVGELSKTGKEKKLYTLILEPFDMERDLLTPTFKKKRPQLLKYYQLVSAAIAEGSNFQVPFHGGARLRCTLKVAERWNNSCELELIGDDGDYRPIKGLKAWWKIFCIETVNLWRIGALWPFKFFASLERILSLPVYHVCWPSWSQILNSLHFLLLSQVISTFSFGFMTIAVRPEVYM